MSSNARPIILVPRFLVSFVNRDCRPHASQYADFTLTAIGTSWWVADTCPPSRALRRSVPPPNVAHLTRFRHSLRERVATDRLGEFSTRVAPETFSALDGGGPSPAGAVVERSSLADSARSSPGWSKRAVGELPKRRPSSDDDRQLLPRQALGGGYSPRVSIWVRTRERLWARSGRICGYPGHDQELLVSTSRVEDDTVVATATSKVVVPLTRRPASRRYPAGLRGHSASGSAGGWLRRTASAASWAHADFAPAATHARGDGARTAADASLCAQANAPGRSSPLAPRCGPRSARGAWR